MDLVARPPSGQMIQQESGRYELLMDHSPAVYRWQAITQHRSRISRPPPAADRDRPRRVRLRDLRPQAYVCRIYRGSNPEAPQPRGGFGVEPG